MLEYTPLLIVGVVCIAYGAYNMGFAKGHIKGFVEGMLAVKQAKGQNSHPQWGK